ncbi:MAG: hypothetical protein AAF762_00255 [Pseudomonadota bacterium]
MADDTPSLHVEFFTEAVESPAKSKEAGRKIFEPEERIRIKWVGDRNRELVAPAHQKSRWDSERQAYLTYAERFARHYEAFKVDQEPLEDGTPLSVVPWVGVAQVAELKAMNVRTVENLAALPDRALPKLGPGYRTLREEAQKFLDASASTASTRALTDQIAELQAQIAKLQDTSAAPAAPASDFAGMSDDDLRAFIQARTGEPPRKNAAREKLIAAAEACADIDPITEAA